MERKGTRKHAVWRCTLLACVMALFVAISAGPVRADEPARASSVTANTQDGAR